MRFVVLVLKGMLYGVTHVSPGLGGGIVLILLGIYGEFVEAIGNLFVKRDRWRQYLGFLIPLGIGMVIGILLAAAMIEGLLTRYPTPTMFVFMGLLIGTIPSVLRLHDDLRPTPRRIAALILGVALVVGIRFAETVLVGRDVSYTFTNAREVTYQSLISFLAGCASVTPGLDGSTVLLLGGTYEPVLAAVSALRNLDIRWAILLPTAVFAALGVVLFSKVIDSVLKRGRAAVYYGILGLIAGSIYGLWSRTTPGDTALWILLLCLLGGAAIAVLLGRVSQEPGFEV
jgi:putative membrane protein